MHAHSSLLCQIYFSVFTWCIHLLNANVTLKKLNQCENCWIFCENMFFCIACFWPFIDEACFSPKLLHNKLLTTKKNEFLIRSRLTHICLSTLVTGILHQISLLHIFEVPLIWLMANEAELNLIPYCQDWISFCNFQSISGKTQTKTFNAIYYLYRYLEITLICLFITKNNNNMIVNISSLYKFHDTINVRGLLV